jgi:class 3 adenylate cyclase
MTTVTPLPNTPASIAAEAPQRRKNEYILVVDDDWMNREVIEAYLQTAGHRVVTASSGPKALEIAEQETPSLVVLDIKMPGMDGLELCARLKSDSRTRFTPVMVVTALEADADKLKAIEAGADDFLTKPFNSLIMLTRVKSLLRIRRLHDELEERNALLRKVLNRYVNEDVAEVILSDPDKHLQLGGETRMITVFFADIRGFTSFSEEHPAKQVVTVLNRIFSELTAVVFKYHGTLDKYVGDEIVGFFGAPVATDDDALNAVRMAVEMQRVFADLHESITDPDIGCLGLGIGIHCGEAAVGNVGSEQLMSYTVIGDTVNIAHRLQQHALPGHILITEAGYRQLESRVEAVMLEPLQLAGKSEPVIAYRVLAVKEVEEKVGNR